MRLSFNLSVGTGCAEANVYPLKIRAYHLNRVAREQLPSQEQYFPVAHHACYSFNNWGRGLGEQSLPVALEQNQHN